jgi:DNA invertase Pin-like site-specific DNA recombinase
MGGGIISVGIIPQGGIIMQQKKNQTTMDNILRVALYLRVSTEEQALRGYSLKAQEEALLQFAAANNMKIVEIYRDEGYSARKPLLKRKVMQRLLEDAKARKFDRILFIKLDRWFRSIAEYYHIQSILEACGVSWQATMEEYRTDSADGRLKVNIMLSVAENEADRTSERIKFVFDSKVARKDPISPEHCLPYGYCIREIDGARRVVKDPETEHIVNEFFRLVMDYNIRHAAIAVTEKYSLTRSYIQWYNMTKNEMYTGRYRGVEEYCEPYLTAAEFAYIRAPRQPARKAKNNRIYLFAGMISCPHCGRRMTSRYMVSQSQNGPEYYYYRCFKSMSGACDYRTIASEMRIEKYLLSQIRKKMEDHLLCVEVAEKEKVEKQQKSESEKLAEKLRRVNVAYFANNMTDEEYTEKTKELQSKIAAAKAEEEKREKPVDLAAIRALLDTDFESIYETLTKEERRRLWRSVVAEIYVDGKEVTGLKFK